MTGGGRIVRQRQLNQHQQFLEVVDDVVGLVGMLLAARKDLLQPVCVPPGAVEKDAGNPRVLGRRGVRGAIPDIPDVGPGRALHLLQRLVYRVRGRFQPAGVVAGHHAVEEREPGPVLDELQFVLQELAGTIGQDADPDAGATELRQHGPYVRLERFDVAVMMTVAAAEGAMGDLLGLLVGPEQHLKQVGARDLLAGDDLRVQPIVLPHVVDQFEVILGLALVWWHQPFPQPELVEHGEHLVHGVIHGLHGVHQGRVPIEEDDAWSVGDSHAARLWASAPVMGPRSIPPPPAACKRAAGPATVPRGSVLGYPSANVILRACRVSHAR